MFFLKLIVFGSAFIPTLGIIPLYHKNIRLVVEREDYLFLPSLVFWFESLSIFVLWFYATLLTELIPPSTLWEQIIEALLFGLLAFDIIYCMVVGFFYIRKYKKSEEYFD